MTNEAPTETEILIYAPKLSRRGWFRAIKTKKVRADGAVTFRWRVFDYPGRGNLAYMPRGFEPEAWRLIEPMELDNGDVCELPVLRDRPEQHSNGKLPAKSTNGRFNSDG